MNLLILRNNFSLVETMMTLLTLLRILNYIFIAVIGKALTQFSQFHKLDLFLAELCGTI